MASDHTGGIALHPDGRLAAPNGTSWKGRTSLARKIGFLPDIKRCQVVLILLRSPARINAAVAGKTILILDKVWPNLNVVRFHCDLSLRRMLTDDEY